MRKWLLLCVAAAALHGQAPPREGGNGRNSAPKEPSEPGIPVENAVVKAKCSGCHRADAKGNLTRISWERTSPEGWQEIIKRMVRLNGLTLTPEEAREVVASLSDTHGLAPEETAKVSWFQEKRQIEDEGIADQTLKGTCASCHPLAQPQSWYRSKEEWTLLVAMHKGYFPVVEGTSFRRPQMPAGMGAPGNVAPPAAGENAERGEFTDEAVNALVKTNPLHTAEWASWQASRRPAKLTGKWAVSAYLPGKGKYIGEFVVAAGPGGSFTTKTTLTSLESGEKLSREGKAVVYTGYAWRGRSTGMVGGARVEQREVMSFSRDQLSAAGRWFWGGYEEFGFDVKLERSGDGPVLLTNDVSALKTGSTGTVVKLYGDGLPTGLTAGDLDFGTGVKVTQIVAQSAAKIEVKVDVDAAAVMGLRDIQVKRLVLPKAVAVYSKIDYIKTPKSALARLGGNTHPKGFYQFVATGWSNGLDGKPNTGDDIPLGPVAAKYSMQEFPARMGDDDIEFVGSLSADGLFTPNIEGPNERRRFGTNNYGDVWIQATYQPEGAPKPLIAKTYFVVAVPLYVRWDQPEVGR